MSKKFLYQQLAVWLLVILIVGACKSSTQNKITEALADQSQVLSDFFLENGDFINDPIVPAILNAAEVYSALQTANILVIDLRTPEQYAEAHIAGSIRIDAAEIIDYMTSEIEAAAFDKIIFVDNRGQVSSYVTAITRLLGFDHTYFIRFGLSSWNEAFAKSGWEMVINNFLEDKMETSSNPKASPSTLPLLQTKGTTAYQIAKEQAKHLLSQPPLSFTKTIEEVLDPDNNFYIVNYWPEAKYTNYGHLTGAIQYTPKKSLHPDQDLLTLPTDRPVIVYCFTGQHSAHVVAYLRMLGYDAYSIIYGSNSFLYETISKNEEKPGTFWSDLHKNNFPFVSGQQQIPEKIDVEIKSIQGGC
ncbi:MAG: rhodanese-like domain-containing protein [Bacteroidales bacterium]|nr:rhodanese-like domain-containing protein [Bacteroidales bacterium]